jgi:hypothetical protein
MMFFGTDFEMHAEGQRYYKEHLTSTSAVTCPLVDGNPDADRLKVEALAAKEFLQTEKPLGNRDFILVQERQLDDTTVSNKLTSPDWRLKP